MWFLFWGHGLCTWSDGPWSYKQKVGAYGRYSHTKLKSVPRSYKDVLPIKQLLYYQRFLFSVIELYVRYDQWLMAPNMHHNLFLIRHFVCTYTHNSTRTTTLLSETFFASPTCHWLLTVCFQQTLEKSTFIFCDLNQAPHSSDHCVLTTRLTLGAYLFWAVCVSLVASI